MSKPFSHHLLESNMSPLMQATSEQIFKEVSNQQLEINGLAARRVEEIGGGGVQIQLVQPAIFLSEHFLEPLE